MASGIPTDEILKQIINIRSEIQPYKIKPVNMRFDPKKILDYPYAYLLSPILSFIFLIIIRPYFIYKEQIIKGLRILKFSIQNFFYSWIILTIILFIIQHKYIRK